MGFLRFLLALVVITAHSGPIFGIQPISGEVAVEAFFMISGFYMALVIAEKYSAVSNYYWLFISNRILRIFPLYWTVLLVTILLFLIDGFKNNNYHSLQLYIDNWRLFSPVTHVYFIISNIIIVGQEVALFFVVDNNGILRFSSHSPVYRNPAYKYFFDYPLWSVSLELMFYLISPFFVFINKHKLLIIIILLLVARVALRVLGVAFDPFIYRLLPLQLVFFLLGVVAYKIYKRNKGLQNYQAICLLTFIYIIVFTLFYGYFGHNDILDFCYLTSFFLAIPFVFILSKRNRIDRFIGDLSYPMYISHVFIIAFFYKRMFKWLIDPRWISIVIILLVIFFSIILNILVSNKIDRYRARRIKA